MRRRTKSVSPTSRTPVPGRPPYPLTFPPGPLTRACPPTCGAHLGDAADVGLLLEHRGVVVDVLDLDDELGLGLHRLLGAPVDGLRLEHVEGLLLAVQLAAGAYLARVLVDLKGVAGALARQDVADAEAPAAVVRLQLAGRRSNGPDVMLLC